MGRESELERRKRARRTDNSNKKGQKASTNGKEGRRSKRKPRVPIWRQALYILLAILFAIVICVTFTGYKFLSRIKNNDMIEAVEPGKNENVNILLLGMDIGDTNQVENDSIKRTDTIMLVNYNPKAKKAYIVSIPRDTKIEVKGNTWKINAAYPLGGEALIKSKVEELLNINVNYMVKVDYNAFRSIVDAIGPIEMEIDRDMIYDDDAQNLHINFKAGEVAKLDGQKAEEFFRWRKNNDGTGFANGDLDRITNQQKLISKIIEKCTSPSIVFKLPKLLDAVAENVDTNISGGKAMSLALDFLSLDKDSIVMTTVQGEAKTISGQSYIVFNKKANSELIAALNSSEAGGSSVGVDKENTKILVLNGTNISGLAAQVKGDLETLGWSKVDVGNTTDLKSSYIATNDEKIKSSLKSDLGKIKTYEGKPEKSEYDTYDVVIFLGKDYKKLDE